MFDLLNKQFSQHTSDKQHEYEKKISIVIPVYNLENYIVECLDSVRKQSFADYEALIVNDGSTDNSEKIICEYIEQHNLKNFYLYNKQNGGISSARNLAIEKATGEWLLFVDGDDWIEPDCLKVFMDVLDRNPSDLVIGGFQAYDCISGESEIWSNYTVEYDERPGLFNSLESFEFCWGRLYKKSIIDEHGLRFDERIKYAEDNAWQFDYNQWIASYSCSNEIVYNYRINRPGSSTLKLVTPQMKYHIWEHMVTFVQACDNKILCEAVSKNNILNRVSWSVLSTAAVNNILEKKYSDAKEIMKMDIAKKILESYIPRTRKDDVFIALWKKPFILFAAFVNIYYRNFTKLRKSKLIRILSKGK